MPKKITDCFLHIIDLTKEIFGLFVRNVVVNMCILAVAVLLCSVLLMRLQHTRTTYHCCQMTASTCKKCYRRAYG